MIRKVLLSKLELDIRDISFRELSEVTNVDVALISKFFNYKHELAFESVLKIVKYVCPEEEIVLMKSFCLDVQRPENMRKAMEYCSLNRLFDELQYLLSNSTNCTNKDWANIYSICMQFQKREKGNLLLLDELSMLCPKTEETKVLKRILQSIMHYTLNEYSEMGRVSSYARESLNNMKEGYIRDCFEMRLLEVEAQYNLRVKNDTKIARTLAEKIIFLNFGPKFVSDAHYLIGTSFLFENYEMALRHYNICIDMLRNSGRHDLAEKIRTNGVDFVRIHWGLDLDQVSTTDVSEIAHLESKWGNKEIALNLLNNLSTNMKDESPFKIYYRALAEDNPNLLVKSLSAFFSKGDKFYANLPRLASKKYSFLEEIVETMYQNFIPV